MNRGKLQSQNRLRRREVTSGDYVSLDGEPYFRIANSHRMDPFFMSLVGASNHWMFLASNGALTAGRRNPDHALFPYYSADKLIDLAATAGPTTRIRATAPTGVSHYWQPFDGDRLPPGCSQNLYKCMSGCRVYFEEVNQPLGLVFRYGWEFSDRYGFVRTCHLANMGNQDCSISILDGFENLLPAGIQQMFQLRFSNLGDAYKKNELDEPSQVGLFYLSSIPTDRAEPSEGLRATVAWQAGLNDPAILLSLDQLERFRNGIPLQTEFDTRGKRGCYLVNSSFELAANDVRSWVTVADLGLDQTDVVDLIDELNDPNGRSEKLRSDIHKGQRDLQAMLSSADGMQLGSNRRRVHRHQSNVVYNLMRGGTPFAGYQICVRDFVDHVQRCNADAFQRNASFLTGLQEPTIANNELMQQVEQLGDADLLRITSEYLPLTFGRRHGDPTRPWNTFEINWRNEDGTPRIDYQGNWRDIFQNWETLGCSYPGFINAMITRFVNSSTADGYNPYRLNKHSFDWEKPDPADPWANIGYWGDHQIIYLQKLLEWSRSFSPSGFQSLVGRQDFVCADIPYRIRDYQSMLENPYQTIDYDLEREQQIETREARLGTDGKLLCDSSGQILRVSMLEKLIVPALVKISNFIPEAGIWLNTQRPEWNDANNALVGNGASVITVCYLRRYLVFLREAITAIKGDSTSLGQELAGYLQDVVSTLQMFASKRTGALTGRDRRRFVDSLQQNAERYRSQLYRDGLSGAKIEVNLETVIEFIDQSLGWIDHTLAGSRRPDGLYHAYNLVRFNEDEIGVEHLYEMLEGQVAVLSSGYLSAKEAIEVLEALRASQIYREDLNSYMLYPDRELPRFLEKNLIRPEVAGQSKLIQTLLDSEDSSIVRRDRRGQIHFNGDFRNVHDLESSLGQLSVDRPELVDQIEAGRAELSAIFEQTFEHHRFTGRSGTFFGYEGLGSVYWHMVSKLGLAVLENYQWARQSMAAPEIVNLLRDWYREIRDGLGIESSPEEFGAFPIDPYSHTPKHAGAQQPGMTGQVKEDILARMMELGIRIRDGVVVLETSLFESSEFLTDAATFSFFDVQGNPRKLELIAGCFGFTFCQVPFVYQLGDQTRLTIELADGNRVTRNSAQLTSEESESLFARRGEIEKIELVFAPHED